MLNKKSSLALVIQVRNASKRFPFKIMKDLSGKPMIERILERVKKVKKVKKIILATTKKKEDAIFVKIAARYNVSCYRGSENDLIDRHYQAVKNKNFDHILRLPSDNAIPDPNEYDRLIDYHIKSENDFSSNLCNFMGNGYPDGIGVEIYAINSLKKIWKREKRKKYREHMTLCFYDYRKDKKNLKYNFKVGTIKCPKKISRPKLILDVNYYKDYIYIKKIYNYLFSKNKFFTTQDVIKWLDKFKIENKCVFELK